MPLPGVFSGTNDDVALLALGFASGRSRLARGPLRDDGATREGVLARERRVILHHRARAR